jgi:hypothetical protein
MARGLLATSTQRIAPPQRDKFQYLLRKHVSTAMPAWLSEGSKQPLREMGSAVIARRQRAWLDTSPGLLLALGSLLGASRCDSKALRISAKDACVVGALTRKPDQQVVGRQDKRSCAVFPSLLQLELEEGVGASTQGLLRQRWAQDVAAEPFKLSSVAAVDELFRMQVDAEHFAAGSSARLVSSLESSAVALPTTTRTSGCPARSLLMLVPWAEAW